MAGEMPTFASVAAILLEWQPIMLADLTAPT
jgi:hypothetical protein